MGRAKQLALEEDAKYQIAVDIAVRSGALGRCEAHDTVLDIYGDPEPAYELANELIAGEDPLVEPFAGNRRELTDTIKRAMEEHGEECAGCAAAMRD